MFKSIQLLLVIGLIYGGSEMFIVYEFALVYTRIGAE